MITILIATANRPLAINACISAILQNTYNAYKILVVDQSTDHRTQQTISSFHSKKIKYMRTRIANKSRALNHGLKYCNTEVIAFLDDDSIVAKNWLGILAREFSKDTTIDAVIGKTLPHKPKHRSGLVYPSDIHETNTSHYLTLDADLDEFGLGNNMAMRTNALLDVGNFKEWLSPGSPGGAYEDTDLIIRMLLQHKKVLYKPTAIVFHDRWLQPSQASFHELQYVRGQMTCYSYFYFQRFIFAKRTVYAPFLRFRRNILSKIKQKNSLVSVVFELKLLAFALRGIISGVIASYKNPYLSNMH